MNENLFDVLMYLFDNCLEEEDGVDSDQEMLKTRLVQAGFKDSQVDKAMNWLEELTLQNEMSAVDETFGDGVNRIFNEQEMSRLDTECRGLISFLEQVNVLDAKDREKVIDRVMALESEEIDLYQLKWVILMVLLNRPGKEASFSWAEEIVTDQVEIRLH